MVQYLKNKTKILLEMGNAYFKTDLRYIVRGGFWLTTAKLVTTGSSFISSIVLSSFILFYPSPVSFSFEHKFHKALQFH